MLRRNLLLTSTEYILNPGIIQFNQHTCLLNEELWLYPFFTDLHTEVQEDKKLAKGHSQ